MKKMISICQPLRVFRLLAIVSVPALLLLAPTPAVAQTPGADSVVAISPTASLVCIQQDSNRVLLKLTVKAKINGTLYKLPLLKAQFSQVTDSAAFPIGMAVTDRNGVAQLLCNLDSLKPFLKGALHFRASIAANKSMDAVQEEVQAKRARVDITPVKEDSTLSVKIKLTDLSADTAIKQAVVGVYVKRLFNPLKITEVTTDDNGEATAEIPANLPGDAKGNIMLVARLDENETFGNLASQTIAPWGLPVSDKVSELPRALWSAHPPIWMLVTFIILMTAVWGHYVVIIYELFRLRKEKTPA